MTDTKNPLSQAGAALGKKGGPAKFKKYGVEHYRQMGKKSGVSRKQKRATDTEKIQNKQPD